LKWSQKAWFDKHERYVRSYILFSMSRIKLIRWLGMFRVSHKRYEFSVIWRFYKGGSERSLRLDATDKSSDDIWDLFRIKNQTSSFFLFFPPLSFSPAPPLSPLSSLVKISLHYKKKTPLSSHKKLLSL